METRPGSYKFVDQISWPAPAGVGSYRGLRIGPSGNDAVLEAVTGTSEATSGVSWRDAKAHHFTLFELIEKSNLFTHKDGTTPRVNGPTFSPDGKHILVTEGFFQGTLAYNAHYPELDVLGSFDAIPVSGESSSYIVPVDVKLQPMPPTQYSDNIRPVFGNQRDGSVSTVSFNPIYSFSWTPVIN